MPAGWDVFTFNDTLDKPVDKDCNSRASRAERGAFLPLTPCGRVERVLVVRHKGKITGFQNHFYKGLGDPTSVQSVAVNWIFSSRIKFVGLEVILGVMTVVGGSGLFLTIWRSLGGPPGEQNVFKKTRFWSKSWENGKKVSHYQTTPYPIHWNEKNFVVPCFRKVLKTTHFDAFLFHRIGYFGLFFLS